MLIRSHLKSRGDTLIEVLFAITIFSLVAVGGLAIMNQGTATSQRALEITLVRQEIDAQAETLRFLNSSYVAAYQNGASCPSPAPPSVILPGPAAQWQAMQCSIIAAGTVTALPFGAGATCSKKPPDGSFILNTHNATFIPLTTPNMFNLAQTFSQVRYDKSSGQVSSSDGIWIEAVRSPITDDSNHQKNAGYIDFNIRACWDSPGQSVPVTIGTIVRLYEPRG
jgi:prepilin-type N-terminal cleavage/methylation domain-containing protein